MPNEPETTEVDLARIEEILARFRDVDGALLPILHAVQGEFGYVPPEAVEPIARFLRSTAPMVYSAVTFYAEFRTKRRAEAVIGVCRGPACRLLGAGPLQKGIERRLGIRAGEMTPDGKIGLETVSCLGICGLAPAMERGHELIGRVDAVRVAAVVDEAEAK